MVTIKLQIWVNKIMLMIGAMMPYVGLRELPEINYTLIVGGSIICIICVNELLGLERIEKLREEVK